MGHFTKANVEKFVAQNATTWGTECMVVRMTWGYRRLLRAEVVALALRSNASEMAHQDQSIIHGDKRPILVRKQSPPIGIPLDAMDEMQNVYASYIQDIVQSDLGEYVPVAYTDQESEFAEELLGAVCNYYSAGLATDNEVLASPHPHLLSRSANTCQSLIVRTLTPRNRNAHHIHNPRTQSHPRWPLPTNRLLTPASKIPNRHRSPLRPTPNQACLLPPPTTPHQSCPQRLGRHDVGDKHIFLFCPQRQRMGDCVLRFHYTDTGHG